MTVRVALASAVSIVVAVVLLGAAVIAILDTQLRDALDRDLRNRAVEVARIAASTPGVLTQPGALEGRATGGALLVEVIDRRGRIVARSSALGGRVLPEGGTARNALTRRRDGYTDDQLGNDPIRVYASPLGELGTGPSAGGAVLVAGSTGDIEDTLAATRTLVIIAGIVAALLAAGLSTLLTRRALRPLRRLSAGARSIARTADASRRLPPAQTDDEVGELAETLNTMLASLERSREAERRFVGDASHELRTPLTALRGNAAYIGRHGPDPDALADLEADANRMTVLLDDLLQLAREDAAAPIAARKSRGRAFERGPDRGEDSQETSTAQLNEVHLSFLERLPLTGAGLQFALERHAGQSREGDRAPFVLHPLESGRS